MWKSFFIAAGAAVAVAIIASVVIFTLMFGGQMGDFQQQCSQLNGVVVESNGSIICRYNTNEVLEYE